MTKGGEARSGIGSSAFGLFFFLVLGLEQITHVCLCGVKSL